MRATASHPAEGWVTAVKGEPLLPRRVSARVGWTRGRHPLWGPGTSPPPPPVTAQSVCCLVAQALPGCSEHGLRDSPGCRPRRALLCQPSAGRDGVWGPQGRLHTEAVAAGCGLVGQESLEVEDGRPVSL